MGKERNNFHYQDPFDSPRASHKRASAQVNGETQMTQRDIVLKVEARKFRK